MNSWMKWQTQLVFRFRGCNNNRTHVIVVRCTVRKNQYSVKFSSCKFLYVWAWAVPYQLLGVSMNVRVVCLSIERTKKKLSRSASEHELRRKLPQMSFGSIISCTLNSVHKSVWRSKLANLSFVCRFVLNPPHPHTNLPPRTKSTNKETSATHTAASVCSFSLA